MGLIRRLRRTLRSNHDEDFVEEMRFHIAQRTDEYVREGLPADEARRRAAREFGNAASLRERTRDADSFRWLTDLLTDLRYGGRTLARNPGLAIAATATLALGIGANTAIFAAAYGVLLRPLPYPDSSRLVRVSEFHEGATSPLNDAFLSDRTFDAWQAHGQALDALAAYGERAYTITDGGDAERVRAAAVSPAFFTCLGLPAAAGRYFAADEALPGADRVVVLSHAYWIRQYGGRADAVGRTVTLDDQAYTIVGIAAPGVAFPSADAQVFTPFVMARRSEPDADRVGVFLAIGRLRPDVTPEHAAAEGTAITRGLGPRPIAADLLFGKGGPVTVRVRTIVDQQTAEIRPVLLLLVAGVSLILLLACANVASLLLTLGVSRERELAVRAALGAGRGRLVRQLLTESLALSIAASGLGVALAWTLIRAWPAIVPADFPRLTAIQLDEVPIALAVTAGLLVTLLVGLAPALYGSRVPAAGPQDVRGGTLGHRSRRVRQALLVAQAAMAVVLVIAATLLVRSFDRLSRRDSGFDASHVVTARVTMTAASPIRFQQVADAVLARLQAWPGIEAAGAANMSPLGDTTAIAGFRLSRGGDGPGPVIARGLAHVVSPHYPRALGLRLREGRLFTTGDEAAPIAPLLVNEAFVRTFLSDGQPVVGRRLPNVPKPDAVAEIIGVVGDVLEHGLTDEPQPEFYLVLGNHGNLNLNREIYLAIRTSASAAELAPVLRSLAREIDPSTPIHHVRDLDDLLASTAGASRFAATAVSAFAAVALGLAAMGLCGGLMYAVSRRTREMGIRTALGATPRSLVGLVFREGALVSGLGLAVGLGAAALLTRAMGHLLYGVDPLDAASFAAAPALLAIVAAIACAIPARRAIAVDPVEAIRED
jgi:predicted permease